MGVFLFFASSCKKDDDNNNGGNNTGNNNGGNNNGGNNNGGNNTEDSFTDSRDGNVYKIVTLGNQVWMAENLKYLPSVIGAATGSETQPYYYVYAYDGKSVDEAKTTENYTTYGALYNWVAAINACPSGWHLPSDAEWTQLENYLADNGYNYDGSIGGCRAKIAKAMASATGWESHIDEGVVGNIDFPEYRNKSGFTALPGGSRNSSYGTFNFIGYFGRWWSASEYDTNNAWYRFMTHNSSNVYSNYSNTKEYGFSVRCVKD